MGKGDRRSKRGKIFRGTFGKQRPKPQKERKRCQGRPPAKRRRRDADDRHGRAIGISSCDRPWSRSVARRFD